MIHAYSEDYLHDAMSNLGEAFDYASSACHIDPEEFMQLFIVSGCADQFGKGNPKIISGLSGTELALRIFSKTGKSVAPADDQIAYDYSADYWCGWILAYYQWFMGYSFRDIHQRISMNEVYKLYSVMHEAPEEKFVDTVNAIIARRTTSTRLQIQRKNLGLTQTQLAEKSGINIRTLQQYESGAKKINKASVQAVQALAAALDCRLDDILELK